MVSWFLIALLALVVVGVAGLCAWFTYVSIKNSFLDEVHSLSRFLADSLMKRMNKIEHAVKENLISQRELLGNLIFTRELLDELRLDRTVGHSPPTSEPLRLPEPSQPKQTEDKTTRNSYDIFLSYASRDKEEADQIYKEVTSAGGIIFLAEKSLRPGEDFAEEIRRALNDSQEVWLLVSPSSLKSDWVVSEWGAAWVLGKKIVPILHRCDIDGLPERIGRLQCVDFYKHRDLINRKFSTANS